MAYTNKAVTVTLETGADLTGSFGEVVTINGSGQAVKADAAAETVYGVVSSEPTAAGAGQAVGVALIQGGGILKCKAGAAIAAGRRLIPSTTAGQASSVAARPTAAGQQSFGVALEAATGAGQIISFLAHTQDSAT